jgi:DNA polymerase-3 subunit delta'
MSWLVIGHERAVHALCKETLAGTPAHAYLFAGPAGIGKRRLARELAAALNCEAEPDDRPCHACRTCRMIDKEAHPDFLIVDSAREERRRAEGDRPVDTAAGKGVDGPAAAPSRRSEERAVDRTKHIDLIRAARETAAWRPYEARYKVLLFADAEEMSEAAANVLLKTIEEPPPQVIIVMTARHVEAVPLTVQSRCRVITLQAVPVAELAEGLQRLHQADADLALRLAALSGGRVGWAVDALSNPDLVAEREAEVDRAVDLSSGPLSHRLVLAGQVTRGESFGEARAACLRALSDMQVWWRDLLLVASGAPVTPVHQDRAVDLARQSERRGCGRIVAGLREIELTMAAVEERNVTPRLALEALLLRLGV